MFFQEQDVSRGPLTDLFLGVTHFLDLILKVKLIAYITSNDYTYKRRSL